MYCFQLLLDIELRYIPIRQILQLSVGYFNFRILLALLWICPGINAL
jgi:hypothetical protein